MATVSVSVSGSVTRSNGSDVNYTLSWSLPSELSGATVNSVRLRVTLSVTRTANNHARIRDSGVTTEYLREYRSGAYTTGSLSSSKISSITLNFRADTGVYVTFDNFVVIYDYTPGYDASSINSPAADAGSALNFTITNDKLSELNHKLRLAFGTESVTLDVAQGVGAASYTIPMAWLQQMTDRSIAYGTVVCETYQGTTLIGSRAGAIAVGAPASAAPTVSLTLLQTGSAIPAGWGIYLQTFSGVDLTVSVQTQQLATVRSIVFSHGTVDSQSQYVSHVDALNEAGTITLTATVTDSRGLATVASQTITVVPYSTPTFSSTSLQRCDSQGNTTDSDGNPLETGTYVLALADVLYSSCNTHNQLSIALDVEVDDDWVPVDDLVSGTAKICSAPPTSDFPSGFDPATVYKFRIRAVDSLQSATERIIYLQFIKMLMHVRDDDTGIAFGMVSRRAGFEFRPDWDVRMYGEKLVDLIYPVGAIYMSVNNVNPGALLGGTWVQIKDTFLLACGDTYANADTGGEATHVLTENEMPSHAHYPTGSTAAERDTWRAALIKDISGRSGKLGMASGSDRYGVASNTAWEDVGLAGQTGSTGGGQAHNNMPPYLAVYMWKRTA